MHTDEEREVWLERLTWPEVESALTAGRRTAIIACGAIEQHGPHLPLLVDAAHGDRLAEEVARRLGDALVAPTIRVGVSEHHLAFPGTVSLKEETFGSVCRDYCTSLSAHGFRTLIFLPSHGGNFRPLAAMLPDLRAAAGPECMVRAYTDLLAVVGVWQRVVEDVCGLGSRVGGHADIAESSVLMAIHPELAHAERAEAGFAPELAEDVIARIIAQGFRTVTPNGILGDARGMTREIGERCIAELVDELVAWCRADNASASREATAG